MIVLVVTTATTTTPTLEHYFLRKHAATNTGGMLQTNICTIFVYIHVHPHYRGTIESWREKVLLRLFVPLGFDVNTKPSGSLLSE